MVSGFCNYNGFLCTRRVALIPRYSFTEKASEGGKLGMAGVYSRPQNVFRSYKGNTRSLYEPIDFPVSTIFL
jgi:hypothetical protein